MDDIHEMGIQMNLKERWNAGSQRDSIRVLEGADTLRLEWEGRSARQDRTQFWFFVIISSFWVPATIVATYLTLFVDAARVDTFVRVFLGLWSLFAWLAVLLLAICFLGRFWSGWIELNREAISFGYRGWLAFGTKTIPWNQIAEINLGHAPELNESVKTRHLNLILDTRPGKLRKRHILGYWLALELKKKVFSLIEGFAIRHCIPVKLSHWEFQAFSSAK